MPTQGNSLPERIEPDAIVEALIELRFEHPELSELVLGRLLDTQVWAGYDQVRLPTADIPQPIRDINPNLRYQPLVELRRSDSSRIAKIGGQVISYHITGAYPGWPVFKAEIETVMRELVEKLKSSQFNRIGLRYINILRPDKHHVRGLGDTSVTLKVGDKKLTESLAVNYIRAFASNHTATVKIATPDLVAGNIPPGFSLLCDIDMATKTAASITDYAAVMAWIADAHTLEKAEFFTILPALKKLSTKEDENG